MPVLTPTEHLRRILVSRTDGLGDVIATLPIAAAIKERLPDVEVAYMVTPYTAPIVRRIPQIDEVLTLTAMRRGLHLMQIYKPDAIIFAKPELQLAFEALLARIDVRIGTGYRWYSGLFTRWVYDHRRKGAKHEAEYGVNLLLPLLEAPLPVRMPELNISEAGEIEAQHRRVEVGITGDYMVIHPGSRGSAAEYTPEGYAAVARALLDEESDLSILITAGPGEEDLVQKVLQGIGPGRRAYAVEDLSLNGLSELLRSARGFLGGSSGPIHLAALVRTPVVGLYPGLPPIWPARWRPIGEHVTTLVPHASEPFCKGCERDHQPENCVKRIAYQRVVEACRGMLIGEDAGTRDSIIS